LEVKDYKDNVLEKYDSENNSLVGEKVLPEGVTYIISHILLDNNARSAAFGADSQLVIPGHTVSVKTGTTDNLRDNWTLGFTPSYLAAVWVGNNDNSAMNPYLVSGVTGAAPIWNQVMRLVLKNQPDEWPKKPEEVEGREVCTFLTNLASDDKSENCKPRYEYFIKGTQPKQRIEKRKIIIDKTTGRPASPTGGPPEPGKTDNLEEQEHVVASDGLTQDYCLDCSHDNEKPISVDMSKVGR
jgi:membrane carboxypeptidase/penicillin-binding protein PbpC